MCSNLLKSANMQENNLKGKLLITLKGSIWHDHLYSSTQLSFLSQVFSRLLEGQSKFYFRCCCPFSLDHPTLLQ